MAERIIIDPGHGGFDAGASYENRKEKDDNLRLALAVGQRLENAGYDVVYTRTADQYDSPFDKAQIANNAQGDLFVSFHRNSSERPNQYNGVQTLVYGGSSLADRVAENVNENLEQLGFRNIGTDQRRELVVLRRTAMPAVLLEVGFINSEQDNALFDQNFSEIADAIVTGIERALPSSGASPSGYRNTFPSYDRDLYEQNTAPADTVPSGTGTLEATPLENVPPESSAMESTSEDAGNDHTTSAAPVMADASEAAAALTMEDASSMSDPGYPAVETVFPGRPGSPSAPQQRPPVASDRPSSPRQRPPVMPDQGPYYYYIQVGLFRQPQNAVYLMGRLRQQGYPVIWHRVSGLIAIWIGPYTTLDEAVSVQRELHGAGHDTLIVTNRLIR